MPRANLEAMVCMSSWSRIAAGHVPTIPYLAITGPAAAGQSEWWLLSPLVGTGHWQRSSGALLPAAMCCWSWLLGHNTRYCSLQLTPAHAIINTNHLLHSLSHYTYPLYTYKLTVNQVSMDKWLMAYECTYLSTDINQNGWEDTEYFNS